MPRTIEIEEQEIRKWTCPKCGCHDTFCPTDDVIRCGFQIIGQPRESGCGAEFSHSEYDAHSVVMGKQDDLLGAVYKLLLEEAARHGDECIVFGALPDGVMTFASGSVQEMAGLPFYWVPSPSGDGILHEPPKDC